MPLLIDPPIVTAAKVAVEAFFATTIAALSASQAALLVAPVPKIVGEATLEFTKKMTELLALQVATSP
ncbi:MAG TPA: hypothetical protein VEG44_00150 [Candidatus Acidoferrales bacterium]|nr:hypothetical protein [Candidatus Acidoferrales bacterium]